MTGFGPFPGLPENPSAALVTRLDDRWCGQAAPGGLVIETHILPTEYRAVLDWVERELSAHAPDILLMFGYSSIADRLKIEARASNQCAPHLADAAGFYPDTPVDPLSHLAATLPLDALSADLDDAGIEHVISDDCGEYVCNHIFYRVQEAIARLAAPTLSGFLHLPPVDFGEGRVLPPITERARPCREMVEAVQIVLRACLAASPR